MYEFFIIFHGVKESRYKKVRPDSNDLCVHYYLWRCRKNVFILKYILFLFNMSHQYTDTSYVMSKRLA